MQKRIFVSYNSADVDVAEGLAARLRESGFTVFIQNSSMQPGEKIEAFIRRAVESSDVILSLISRNSLLSAWVGTESMAGIERASAGKRFVGCYLDRDFLDPRFRIEATQEIDRKIDEIQNIADQHRAAKLDTDELDGEKSRLYSLRSDLGKILAEFKASHNVDLTTDSFDAGVGRLVESLRNGASIEPVQTPPANVAKAPGGGWLKRNAIKVGLVAVMAGVISWAVLFEVPRLDRISDAVKSSSIVFMRSLGESDASAIAQIADLPLFFGDHEFDTHDELIAFLSGIFVQAQSESGINSDSIAVRRAAAASRYLAGEMRRTDFDVFQTMEIKIRPELDSEKEEDRGPIPPPRFPIEDGARAAVGLIGFREVGTIYLYFSAADEATRLRGVLLQGDR